LTDAELLAEFRAHRSERAFDQIVARHGAMVFRTCRRLVGTAHEAEDAAQAAFLVLAQRPDAVNSPLASWLHWVARNTSYKVVRARGRRARHEERAATMRATVLDTENPTELREELDRALGQLPAALREAVILRYLEGHGQEEASRRAGVPQGTMARRSMEGLNRLRAILGRRGIALTSTTLLAFLAKEASAALPVTSLVPYKLMAAARLGGHATNAALVADSVISAMFWAKVKWMALTTAAVVTLTVGLGIYGWRSGAAVPPNEVASADTGLLVPPNQVSRVLVGGDPVAFCPADTEAIAPDGRTTASARCDGTIKVWDGVTGKLKATLRGHWGRVRGVAFAPNGRLLASGSWDATVKLWDTSTGKLQRSLDGHRNWVWAVAFAPDGKRVASASTDGTAKVWDVESGQCLATMVGHRGAVFGVAFSRDGKTLATGSADGTVKFWDAATGKAGATVNGQGIVYSVAFSPKADTLAVSDTQGVWLCDTAEAKERWRVKRKTMQGVAFAPSGNTVAATGGSSNMGGAAETILVEAATGKEVTSFKQANCYGWSVAFAPDEKTLAVGELGCVTFLNPEANKKRAAKP
jgi:RNA polymerase sigma factor (sigma-70 family)